MGKIFDRHCDTCYESDEQHFVLRKHIGKHSAKRKLDCTYCGNYNKIEIKLSAHDENNHGG